MAEGVLVVVYQKANVAMERVVRGIQYTRGALHLQVRCLVGTQACGA